MAVAELGEPSWPLSRTCAAKVGGQGALCSCALDEGLPPYTFAGGSTCATPGAKSHSGRLLESPSAIHLIKWSHRLPDLGEDQQATRAGPPFYHP